MAFETRPSINPVAPGARRGRSSGQKKSQAEEFGFGIEEEYFLCHAETMAAACQTPAAMFEKLARITKGRAGHESLQAQLEVSTAPKTSIAEARDELMALRATAADVAKGFGFSILAAGTHPLAEWKKISHTPSERYDGVMDALQMIGRRNMVCGMHVHVELPDPSRRVELMVRIIPFTPLLIALSTSSPFWCCSNTGLKGYRLAAYDELPRTGLPELFESENAYNRYVDALVTAGVMRDASHIWWALRPSLKYPTLELRAPDCCTHLEDAIAIAALFRVLTRHLFRNAGFGPSLSPLTRAIAVENKWRAQRFGIHGSFATEAGAISVPDYLQAVIEMTAEDADALGCASEVEDCLKIIERGTSADTQLDIFFRSHGMGQDMALTSVARWCVETTTKAS